MEPYVPVIRAAVPVHSTDASGNKRRHEITGVLKYLYHSCRPNAELGGFCLKALVAIRAGQEITMSYGEDACDCDREAREMDRSGKWNLTINGKNHVPYAGAFSLVGWQKKRPMWPPPS